MKTYNKHFCIILIISVLFSLLCSCQSSKVDNVLAQKDSARKNPKGRYITIVNDIKGGKTVINHVHIYDAEGSEIESAYQENPDEQSFSIIIPKSYKSYDSFKVKLIDNYGVEYNKEISKVKKKGRTTVTFTEEDKDESTETQKIKIERLMNGD